jgi:hypothetical protein
MWLWFPQIDENVYREIVNHRYLDHPNIVKFIEVGLEIAFSFVWLCWIESNCVSR